MDNEQIIRGYIEEVENKGNVDAYNKYLTPHFQTHSLHLNPEPVGDTQPKTYKEALQQSQDALSNSHKTINDIFMQENKVVVSWTVEAINTGKFMGNPPTNKKVTYSGITIFRLESGKIAEYWYVWDRLGLYQQLGIVKS